MSFVLRLLLYPVFFLLGVAVSGAALLLVVILVAWPNLPDIAVLTDYRPRMPMQIYSSDGYLIGEFGEERRAPVRLAEVPLALRQALLAAEDDGFYRHHGVDPTGIARAMLANIRTQGMSQGASTITQQVARNFFLPPDRTLARKFYEALLSFKIESSLSKDQIFEIYINQIYLGQRAYGFAAAAQTYFGKPLSRITLAEAAMLAGLPKAPSRFNPVVNPKRARSRQQYVLNRMVQLGNISEAEYRAALDETLVVRRDSAPLFPMHAEYVAEMARQIAAERFSPDVYSAGVQVITTINKTDQENAYHALRQGVLAYDRRHGYRGAEGYVDLRKIPDGNAQTNEFEEALDVALQNYPLADNLLPAVVLSVSPKQLSAYVHGGHRVTLKGADLAFAARMLDERAAPDKKLRPGAVIRVERHEDDHWEIAQLPEVEAAFMVADPEDGRVRALIGGFDFNHNMYNHVTQAWRQPGSSFKPFIFSAALEKGFSPGSVVMDAPLEIPADTTGSRNWSPRNYDGTYSGPMTLRTALAKSKNVPAVLLLQAITPVYAQDYVTRFGFEASRQPPYLTLALGAGSVTPWQMVGAYSVFANGGYRVQPYIVKEIRNHRGQVLARAAPRRAGDEAIRAVDARNAYLMYTMLNNVANYGTAARAASVLKRSDLAGKTGTTNDFLDAWFCGFHPSVVGCAWMGFDQPHRMGSGENGGRAALPIWIDFMKHALADEPVRMLPRPPGISAAFGDIYYSENIPLDPSSILGPDPGLSPDADAALDDAFGNETPFSSHLPSAPQPIAAPIPVPPVIAPTVNKPKPAPARPGESNPPATPDPSRILGGA